MAILKVANTFFDGSGNSRLQVATANTIQIFTSNSERMKLEANGVISISGHTFIAGMNVTPTVQAAFDTANTASGSNVLGKQTIWVPATSMTSQITNGAAYGQLEMSTNGNMISYLAFDSTASEGAQFSIQMPKSWNEGNVIAQTVWTHPVGTAAANSVVWGFRSVARANNETLDVAFGPYTNTTSRGGTANSVYISPETINVAISTASAPEEYVTFQVTRQTANASDTMGVDAYLLGVKIHYTIDAAKDN